VAIRQRQEFGICEGIPGHLPFYFWKPPSLQFTRHFSRSFFLGFWKQDRIRALLKLRRVLPATGAGWNADDCIIGVLSALSSSSSFDSFRAEAKPLRPFLFSEPKF